MTHNEKPNISFHAMLCMYNAIFMVFSQNPNDIVTSTKLCH